MIHKGGNYFDKYHAGITLEKIIVRRFIRQVVCRVCDLNPRRVIDVGCGEGFLTEMIHDNLSSLGSQVVGLDIDSKLLAMNRSTASCQSFAAGSAYALPFSDGAFNLVLATEVLEHLESPEAALEEFCRVSSQAVLVTVPFEPYWRILNCLRGRYWTERGNTPGHLQHWSRRGFIKLLKGHLAESETRVVFPWLLGYGKPARS